MTLKELIQNEEKCNALLRELDRIARDIDCYEYGLPIYSGDDSSDMARMREAIYRWASEIEN